MSVPPYFFGVYHWRERLRRIAVSALLLVASVVGFRRGRRAVRAVAVVVASGALYRGGDAVRRLGMLSVRISRRSPGGFGRNTLAGS